MGNRRAGFKDFLQNNKPNPVQVTEVHQLFETPQVAQVFNSVKPVDDGLKSLNFNYVKVGAKPIVIDDINDTTGSLSTRLEKMESKYGISVIPYEATGLMRNVKNLQRHDLIELYGSIYTSGNQRIVNEASLYETIENIKLSLESGNPYIGNISTVTSINNVQYRTLKFNIYELSYIKESYRNYNPQIKQNVKGDIILLVGNYE